MVKNVRDTMEFEIQFTDVDVAIPISRDAYIHIYSINYTFLELK